MDQTSASYKQKYRRRHNLTATRSVTVYFTSFQNNSKYLTAQGFSPYGYNIHLTPQATKKVGSSLIPVPATSQKLASLDFKEEHESDNTFGFSSEDSDSDDESRNHLFQFTDSSPNLVRP